MKNTLVIAIVLAYSCAFAPARGHAQCIPADSCGVLPCLFGPTIFGTTIWSNAGYTAEHGNIPFCSGVQNDLWFPFVADSSGVVQVTITPVNSANGHGLQAAIYESCYVPIACNAGQQDGGITPISMSVAVIPGQLYYMMVDGYGGDICDFTIQATGILDVVNTGLVTGRVWADLNFDCVVDSTDIPVPEVPVVASNLFSVVVPADSLGRFVFYYSALGAQNFDISINLGGNALWELCTDTFHISPNGNADTTLIEFLLQPQDFCTDMRVDLGMPPFLRPCQDITIPVKYSNQGTRPAENVVLDLVFPADQMSIQGATVPFDQLGDTLRFFPGDVPVFDVGQFRIFARTLCDGDLAGHTLCLSAHIFPDSACHVNPDWSGARVAVSAVCDGDSLLRFGIRNTGTGPMSGQMPYRVISNAGIVEIGMFQLNAGQDTTLAFAADGSTWRIEADQELFHPGMSKPSASLEGCGGLTPGYVNAFPQDDADLFRDIECRMVMAAYDPNIKVASPSGTGSNHLIQPNVPLEYTIHFQNTGTDTAFLVRLIDVLPSVLDPATFRPGTSSHPCTWRLLSGDTLEILFDPIVLPDSTTNEPASHGWFEFSIAQRPNLPNGTILRNSAAIYFDYNDPVITDPAIHTIGQLTVHVDDVPGGGEPGWQVLGNPLQDRCVFEATGEISGPHRFELFDLQGRLLRTETFDGGQFVFHRQGQAPGVYLFRLVSAQRAVFSGKLVMP
ncbi:MAG: DUF11 domain-containing protein [Saprospiraceae bacterium]|jgi:uncharacterized repeat protein (TIGR01451 family)|nr:DUF11 domain-containing protein [Saprospiraceae bacterium]